MKTILALRTNDSNKWIQSSEVWHQFCKFILTWSEHSQMVVNDGTTEEKWIDNLNKWVYLHSWIVATIYSNSHWGCYCGEKTVNQRWRYKSKWKIELKSNFTFKWFANVDVNFEMNVVNDHSWEFYTCWSLEYYYKWGWFSCWLPHFFSPWSHYFFYHIADP